MRSDRSYRRHGVRRLWALLCLLEAWSTVIVIGAVRLWRLKR